ncbi:hypothetical protein MPL3356_60569 [Mesorhizobium plurifarium]|uniref:Uncharacterized protein n=1 Tax=Mesorhizobium plurifarium TaxID=69974 RepID=A0A090EFD5_MESPL|nr:hypothetical protein MPL3356_60569 [Mesorhizobium plurifarium]
MDGVTKMPARFVFRRWNADDFAAALKAAGLSRNDFMFMTGRHSDGVAKYLDPNDSSSPTLAEMILVELAGRSPERRAEIMQLADEKMIDMGNRKDRR